MNKLLSRVEICKDNMDTVSKEETINLVLKIIDILKSMRISNMRASDTELNDIILNIRKDENYRFKTKLEGVLYNQEIKLKKEEDIQRIIEDNLIELRMLFLQMEKDSCFIDFSDRSLEQIMEYLISKNRTNPMFEQKYYDIKDELKHLLKNKYQKYMTKMCEANTNLMVPLIKRDNEELLDIKEEKNETVNSEIQDELNNFKLF